MGRIGRPLTRAPFYARRHEATSLGAGGGLHPRDDFPGLLTAAVAPRAAVASGAAAEQAGRARVERRARGVEHGRRVRHRGASPGSSDPSMTDLTLGIVTDLHFGPEARHEGKLRKLTAHAPELTRAFVREMNEVVKPDLVVNLGDDIEDESRDKDLERYGECQAILRTCTAPLVNVAGNHDLVNMNRADISAVWERTGPLYYEFDSGDWHIVVLHTIEAGPLNHVPEAQLEWLRADLEATTQPVVVLMHHSASEQDLDDSRWFHGRTEYALVRERAAIRRIFEDSGKVRLVLNGHLHRNHCDVIRGSPYVTVQSLIEKLDDDAPGRPASAHAIVRLSFERIVVRVRGNDPARYQFETG
jgi:predicted phosphodiesterase